jgi:hypothetical protein
MSLLINGVGVPSGCFQCRFLKSGWSVDWVCSVTNNEIHLYAHDSDKKPSDCPLVEIPTPHGRLIDADKFLKDNADFADRDFIHPLYDETLRDLIDEAPTVIESEV